MAAKGKENIDLVDRIKREQAKNCLLQIKVKIV